MPILQTGTFSFILPADALAKGLRPSQFSPRNVKYLTNCEGAVGIDNVLQTPPDLELSRIISGLLVGVTFPYPQIFICTNTIVVCSSTTIFEYNGTTLTSKLAGLTVGTTWSLVDFHNFIYMSNGKQAVIRRAEDQVWAISATLPAAGAICNFNGQVFLGSPS